MAGVIAEAAVRIRPDTSGFKRETESQVRGVGASIGAGIGKAAKVGVLAAAGGAALGIGVVLKAGFGDFMESAKVAAQTEAAIKSTGGAANVTAGQISNLAGAIQKKSGIDDEAAQAGENLLLTFTNIRNEAGKGNDIFTQSSNVLADLSTAMGTDMSSSAVQLGKALNDPVKGITALTRVGVTFDEGQKKTIKTLVESGKTMEAQKIILKELNKEFGGSAEAAGKTLPGKIAILKGQFENFAGSLIGKMQPAISGVLDFLSRGLPKAADLAGRAIDAVGGVINRFRQAKGFKAKLEVVADVAKDVGKGLFNKVRDAIGKVDWSKVWSGAVGFASGISKQVGDAIDNVDWGKVGTSIVDGVKKAMDGIGKVWDKVISPLIDAINRNRDKIAEAGAALIAQIFVTITDPAFWIKHWQLALAVGLTAFGGSIGKLALNVGRLAATAFGRFGDDIVRAIIPSITKVVPLIGNKLAGAFVGVAGPLERLAPKLFDGVINGIKNAFNSLPGIIQKVFKTAFVFIIIGAIQDAVNAARTLATSVITTVTNTLNGVVDKTKEIWRNVVSTITGAVTGAAGAAKNLATQVVNGFVNTVKTIADKTKEIWRSVVGAITGAVTGAVSAAKAFASGVAKAITDTLGTLAAKVKQAFAAAIAAITGAVGAAGGAAKTFAAAIVNGVVKTVDGIGGKVKQFIGEAVAAVSGAVTRALSAAKSFGTAIVNGVANTVGAVVGAVSKAIGAAVNAVASAVGRARTAAVNVGNAIVNGVTAGVQGVVAAVTGAFQKLWGWIQGAAATARAFASAIGREIVNGIKGGFDAVWESTKSFIVGKVTGLVDAVKHPFGIGSPSKVMAKEIGEPLAQGIAVGVEKGAPLVKTSIVSGIGKAIKGASKELDAPMKLLAKSGIDSLFAGFYTAAKEKSASTSAASSKAITGGLYSDNLKKIIISEANRLGLDAAAALAVASHEGLDMAGSGIGDSGSSFGPFQLHQGGALGNQFKGTAEATQKWALSLEGVRYAMEGIKKVVGDATGAEAIRRQAALFERPADIPGEIADATSKYSHYADVVKRLSPTIGAGFDEIGKSASNLGTTLKEKTLTPADVQELSRKVLKSGGKVVESLLNGMDLGDKVPSAFTDAFDKVTAKIEKGGLSLLGLGKKIVKPLGDDINQQLFVSLFKGGALPKSIGGKRAEAVTNLLEELAVGIDKGSLVLENASDRLGFNVGIKLKKSLVKNLAFGGEIPAQLKGKAGELLGAIFPQEEQDFAPVLNKGKLIISNGTDKLITDIRGKITKGLVDKLLTGGEIPAALKGRGREALEAFLEGAQVKITQGQAVLVNATGKLGFAAGTKLSDALWQSLVKGGEIPKRLGGLTGEALSTFLEDAKTKLERGKLLLTADGTTVGVSIAKSVNAGLIKNLLRGGDLPDGIQGPLRTEIEKAMKVLPLVVENGMATLKGSVQKFGFNVAIPLKNLLTDAFKGGAIPSGVLGEKIQKILDASTAKLQNGRVVLTGQAQQLGFSIGQKIPESMLRAVVLGGQSIPDKIGGQMRAALERAQAAIAPAREKMAAAFQGLTQRIKTVWDAGTQAGIRQINARYDNMARDLQNNFNRQVKIVQQGLRDQLAAIEQARAGLTPTEKLIQGLQAGRAAQGRAEAIADAQAELLKAQAAGDPEEIKRAQKAVDDAQFEQRLFDLQVQADAERKSQDEFYAAQAEQAQAAADAAQEQLASELERRQASLAAQREREILDYQSQRDEQWLINQAFLDQQWIQLQKHPEQWQQVHDAIMQKFGVEFGPDYEEAGRNLGRAFAEGIESQVARVRRAAEALARAARGALPHSPADYGPLKDLGRGWEPGEILGQVFAEGIANSAKYVRSAMGTMLGPTTTATANFNTPSATSYQRTSAALATSMSWDDGTKLMQTNNDLLTTQNALLKKLLGAVEEPGSPLDKSRVDAALAGMLT